MTRWNDTEMEIWMGRLLQAGVLIAGLVMVAGGILYLTRHGFEIPEYQRFHGVPPDLKTFSGILNGLAELRARAIIQLGVLIMIATPVLRVAFAIVAFAVEEDWWYAGVSSIVLSLLAYALFWAS
ncbi:MAG TPA: DUF1634 domain-containing protein [Bryobacteraceae bacterium]|jgi:uncharacterized membrane protein|nr:DUF1634 domain-containing protein [Bryobacteraceae bacterium]